MAKFAKWIGGGLGWVMTGGTPLGAIVGFMLGSLLDVSPDSYVTGKVSKQTTKGGYIMSLLVLIAAVMKADGRIMRSELDYVKAFLRHNFGEESANEAVTMLRDLLKQNIPIADVCRQIKSNMNYSARLQMLHFLFGVAQADKSISNEEMNLIDFIAREMGITNPDYVSIKAMFIQDTNNAYKILEVEPTAPDDDIKKAYRRMAMKYHPDKLATMGEEVQKAGQDKFRKVNEAYQAIKKERNMS
ncbi:MAG: TerB family tellurite resistance protein [Prolixibacteraceae bacterium]|nr:TerB family tellurite resistance protein [Prolixibacteraceae bacterium]